MRPKLDFFTRYVNQQLKKAPPRRAFPVKDMSFVTNLKYTNPIPPIPAEEKLMINSTDTLLINDTDNFLIF